MASISYDFAIIHAVSVLLGRESIFELLVGLQADISCDILCFNEDSYYPKYSTVL